jgi:hypothetical protein
MWSAEAALEHGSGPRHLKAIMSGLGVLAAAGRFLMVLDSGLVPPSAWADAEALIPASALAPPSSPRLCFHGSGDEILTRHCP